MPLIDTNLAHYRLDNTSLSDTDSSGVDWFVHQLEGWDSADVRLDLASRVNQHGSYDGQIYYDARKMTLEGTYLADTIAARREAEARFQALTSDLDYATLSVDEPPYFRQIHVKRAGRITRVIGTDGRRVRYTLPLIAADPRRYSQTEYVNDVFLPPAAGGGVVYAATWPLNFGASDPGGQLVVNNQGDIETFPNMWIYGPIVNPTIWNQTTNQLMSFAITVVAGDFLYIGTTDRVVFLNDTASRRYTLAPDSKWINFRPGLNTIQFRGTDPGGGPPRLNITYRSAWS